MKGWVNLGTQHAALTNIIQDYIAHGCEKLAQGFYTAATWPGVGPRIYDTLVRRSTSKPPSHPWGASGVHNRKDYKLRKKNAVSQKGSEGMVENQSKKTERYHHNLPVAGERGAKGGIVPKGYILPPPKCQLAFAK